MTPTIFKVNRLFSTAPYENIQLGMEGTVDPGETYEEAVVKAHQQIVASFEEIWPFANLDTGFGPGVQPSQQTPLSEIKVEKIPEEERVRKLIDDLNTCTTLKVLESYKLIAKLNPTVQAAYDMKYKELTNANK